MDILSLIISFIQWLFKPKQIYNYIFSLHKKRNCKQIKQVLKDSLLVNNDSSLDIDKFVTRNHYVYFPVVPKANLSIIHLTFINKIYTLNKIGLKVLIFVFDEYYMRTIKSSRDVANVDIGNFIDQLKNKGIRKTDILLESQVNRNKALAKRILQRVLDLSSMISLRDMLDIKNKTASYIRNNDFYIKFQKILFNMAYASVFKKIGFVLCGEDEIYMWQKFIDIENKRDTSSFSSRIVILSIKKMKNTKGNITSIWDEKNLSTNTSKDIIRKGIEENCSDISLISKECGIFYLLDNVYFSNYNSIEINSNNNSGFNFKDIDSLIEYFIKCKEDNENLDEAIESLTDVVYNILNQKI
ncbi:hypothetical protein ACJEEO_11385 [Phocaeicola coprocola]|uniref:hypothetical protein n=1 Tax=Phocaeicola coprocola TaxID=310298 RepID=UPI00397DE5E3